MERKSAALGLMERLADGAIARVRGEQRDARAADELRRMELDAISRFGRAVETPAGRRAIGDRRGTMRPALVVKAENRAANRRARVARRRNRGAVRR